MEQFARYGKAIAAGGAILLCVLGASSASQASVPFTETFDGTLDITQNTIGSLPGHSNVTLQFVAHDLTNPGNTFVGNAFIDDNGNGLPTVTPPATAVVPFEFTGTFDGLAGDLWSMDLQEVVGLDGTVGSFPSVTNSGNFTFIVPSTGPVTENPAGNNFSFNVGDPLVANGDITSDNAGAPELGPGSMATPLALAVSALLMLSDGRRRRQDDIDPS